MTAQRMMFFTFAIVLSTGIWLTGFDNAHWILYVPAVILPIAGLTGICPGITIWKKLGFK